MTWAEFNAEVRTWLSDSSAGDVLFVEAAVQFVRARWANELFGDEGAARNFHNLYRAARKRLAGYAYVGNDAALKAAISARLSDGAATSVTFEQAVADYVQAVLMEHVVRDVERAKRHTDNYRQARTRLLGYTYAGNDAALKAAVVARISDGGATDSVFEQAVADYVQAVLMEHVVRDVERAKSFMALYQQLKLRLLGYSYAGSDAALKAAVIARISDGGATDTTFEQAVTNYVQANMLAHHAPRDVERARPFREFYQQLRLRLLGYAYSGNDAALKAAVKASLADVTPTDALFERAAADYVKAMVAREVQGDTELFNSCMASFAQWRLRLAGYTYVGNDATLIANVKVLLTVDGDRTGVIVPFREAQVLVAKAELQGFDVSLSKLIADAKLDLLALDTHLAASIAAAKSDLTAFNGHLTASITSARADLTAFDGHFASVVAAAKQDLLSLAPLVDAAILGGVRELQRAIPRLRAKNTNTILSDTAGVAALGEASKGSLPDGWWRGREARIIRTVDEEDLEHPCILRDWADRHLLIAGDLSCAYICVDPVALEFVMSPQLGGDENVRLLLVWDGIKQAYQSTDPVQFDDHCAQAVAAYVKAEIERQADGDEPARRSYLADWINLRTDIFLDQKRKGSANAEAVNDR